MSSYYPAFVNINGKDCVVVGGGSVAERKVMALLDAGAKVTVISDKITKRLLKEKQKGSIQHLQRPYKIGDTKNFFLVIAATDDEAVNRQISQEARFLLNVVDNPGLSNFIVPAVLKDGDLTIAISTGGISPAIARSIKTDLKSYISIDIKRYLRFLKSLRKDVFKSNLSFKIRNEFLKFSGSMEILQMLRNDGYGKTKKMVLRKFKEIKKA